MDLKRLLRSGSGPDSFDDRELQVRISLAANAPLSLHHRRASSRRFCGRLAKLGVASLIGFTEASFVVSCDFVDRALGFLRLLDKIASLISGSVKSSSSNSKILPALLMNPVLPAKKHTRNYVRLYAFPKTFCAFDPS